MSAGNGSGDQVILATYADMTPEEAKAWRPVVVRVDSRNRATSDRSLEVPGPILNSLDQLAS